MINPRLIVIEERKKRRVFDAVCAIGVAAVFLWLLGLLLNTVAASSIGAVLSLLGR